MIPRVVASETGRAQTYSACIIGVVGLLLESNIKPNLLERRTRAGESPVGGPCCGRVGS
jgi:hypothetical protein